MHEGFLFIEETVPVVIRHIHHGERETGQGIPGAVFPVIAVVFSCAAVVFMLIAASAGFALIPSASAGVLTFTGVSASGIFTVLADIPSGIPGITAGVCTIPPFSRAGIARQLLILAEQTDEKCIVNPVAGRIVLISVFHLDQIPPMFCIVEDTRRHPHREYMTKSPARLQGGTGAHGRNHRIFP